VRQGATTITRAQHTSSSNDDDDGNRVRGVSDGTDDGAVTSACAIDDTRDRGRSSIWRQLAADSTTEVNATSVVKAAGAGGGVVEGGGSTSGSDSDESDEGESVEKDGQRDGGGQEQGGGFF
jgi:hypothetical protein